MVTKFERYFSPAGENRGIHLYLPDDYFDSQERYPVIYMFDGHNLYFDSDATFGKSLGMKDFLDHWGKKFIVVGIACADDDIQRVQNFKNAAHYDLKTVKIVPPDGEVTSVANAALNVLDRMTEFYKDFPDTVQEVLAFEREKFIDRDNRYAWKIRRTFDGGFVKKGLELARQRQEEADV